MYHSVHVGGEYHFTIRQFGLLVETDHPWPAQCWLNPRTEIRGTVLVLLFMVMNLYSAFPTCVFKCTFCKL